VNLAWARRNGIPEERVRGIEDPERGPFTPRERAILRLAELMAHRSDAVLEGAVLEELRRELSDEELVELGMYFALVTGFQKFNSVFRIFPACELEPSRSSGETDLTSGSRVE